MYRYFNIEDTIRLSLAFLLNSLLFLIYSIYFDQFFIVNQLLFFFFSLGFLLIFRILIKIIFSKINKNSEIVINILVFGAGDSGVITKRAFYNSPEYKILGFIDDDKYKIGKILDGVPVFKLGDKLNKFVVENNVSRLIISTDKISTNRQSLIFKYFKDLNIQLFNLPPVKSWINGMPNISRLKEVKIEDLLSRGLIKIDNKLNSIHYNNKIILVTGAAGSIGSEIIRQIIRFNPKQIILLDNAETPMFHIKQEIDLMSNKIETLYYLNSVTDKQVLEKIFSKYKIDIVFHAAAYKHVNMMEANPRSSIINNVYGAKLIIDFSIINNVKKFVLISTDKAVNPTNVMGASKRICELYLASQISDEKVNTKFIITRFGNVLGSNGSVVPIFEEQIKKGGPITITHAEIERFFMTISEACQLVLEAGTMGAGGEVFIFDMGDPVKIIDLAKNMIVQKGLKIGQDIEITFTGLRPGEKLYEELLLDSETLLKTYNDLIFIAKKDIVGKETSALIDNLIDMAFSSFDNYKVVTLMKKIVPEYISNHSEFQILDNNEKISL
tara:strand:+ start:2988 stop:4652 length:1665 start_codon:yes stop_codon:yes gene_type:complete